MRPEGWVFMLSSVGAVLALVSFCYYKLLTMAKTGDRGNEKEAENPPPAQNRKR